MLKKYNRYKLLKIFLDSPTESFRLRELSRLSGIAPLSVSNYLREFIEEELIEKYIKRNIPYYQALRDSEELRLYKKLSIIYELNESGLIDYLWESLAPEAVILYGSYAKGESIEESDIDLFIIGKETKIDLKKYEKMLGKEIHLMFKEDVNKIPKELMNNLINGVVIKGYFKVV